MDLPDFSKLQKITDLDLKLTSLNNDLETKQNSLTIIQSQYSKTLEEDELLITGRISIKLKRKAISDQINELKIQESILKKKISTKLANLFGNDDVITRQKALNLVSKSIYKENPVIGEPASEEELVEEVS